MPTFPTPTPIVATIEVIGDVQITAGDRADTVVVVHPADPSKAADARAAEQTTVDCRDGRLFVRAPRRRWQHGPFGNDGSVRVTVELPTGSRLDVSTATGHITTEGRLGDCRLKSSLGDLRAEQTAALRAATTRGTIAIGRVDGDAQISIGSGDVRVEEIGGAAVVKHAEGDTTIGEVHGDLRVKGASGDTTVGRAHASTVVKTAKGDIGVGEVGTGTVVLVTATGDITLGVPAGSTAWFDATTRVGAVRNTLDGATGPAPDGNPVKVYVRTSVGDIVIGRSSTGAATGATEPVETA